FGPAAMYRAFLTADLLTRQTERAWQDHWFDDNPAAEPYFRTVCRSHQIDTQALVAAIGSPAAWKESLQPWEKKLQAPGQLFRGQQIRQETRVEVQPTADIIVRQLPLPDKASVAVRTRRDIYSKAGSAQGALAFIVDASGSMRPVDPAFPEKSRYAQALSALA